MHWLDYQCVSGEFVLNDFARSIDFRLFYKYEQLILALRKIPSVMIDCLLRKQFYVKLSSLYET
jgi:hypothetical protein